MGLSPSCTSSPRPRTSTWISFCIVLRGRDPVAEPHHLQPKERRSESCHHSSAEGRSPLQENIPLSCCSLSPSGKCVCAQSLEYCPHLWEPMDSRLPGFFVHGILQARTLKWVAMSSSRGSSPPRYQTKVSYVSCIGRGILYH